ncbi:MAG: LLM class flavin-dependent oxidoreductase [Parahaliea sp.]
MSRIQMGIRTQTKDELDYVVEAERLGCHSVWVPEPYGHDCVSFLGAIAATTKHIGIGSAIMAIPGRTPAMRAQSVATLDWLSAGGMHLGLGVSGPQVSEGWHGVRFSKPLARTKEYVEVVRQILARDKPLSYRGQLIELPLARSRGKPLKLIMRPERNAVPVYLASIGPASLELCGEIAMDGCPSGWRPKTSIFSTNMSQRAPISPSATPDA